jgi:4-amino-4-deoxy-L-arabinose transferase
MPRLRCLVAWLLLPLALSLTTAGFVYQPLKGVAAWLVLASLVALALWWQIWSARKRNVYWGWLALFMIFFSCIGFWGAGIAGPQMRGYQKMAAEMNRLDPNRRLETLVFQSFLPSLSFYRNRLAVMAFSGEREVQFQSEASYRPWKIDSEEGLKTFLDDHPELFVVARQDAIGAFSKTHSLRCEPIFAQRKHTAYRCESTSGSR